MSNIKSKTTKTLVAVTIGGLAVTGLGAFSAAPAQAAAPPPVSGSVNVNLDVMAMANAIRDAVNDQNDRGGAVRAALDVGFYNRANPDRLTVAVVNKNADINVEGSVAHAEPVDIKGGSYVIYWFDGPGRVTNNGDGGWINWGVLGNIEHIDNVITVNGG